jgi:hypothetical protein
MQNTTELDRARERRYYGIDFIDEAEKKVHIIQ